MRRGRKGRDRILTADTVAEIRRVWDQRPTAKSLAVKYGVSPNTIHRITAPSGHYPVQDAKPADQAVPPVESVGR